MEKIENIENVIKETNIELNEIIMISHSNNPHY